MNSMVSPPVMRAHGTYRAVTAILKPLCDRKDAKSAVGECFDHSPLCPPLNDQRSTFATARHIHVCAGVKGAKRSGSNLVKPSGFSRDG